MLLANTVLFAFLLPGCTSSEETENSSNTSGSESQTASFTAPDKSKSGSGRIAPSSQNGDELKVVFEEDDYPVVFSTDAGNLLKIPQENADTTVKLLCHDPGLKIAEEIKQRGRSLSLATGQTDDGTRIWAVTRYGGRIWDAATGKELASYYLKFPARQTSQGSRSPQALGLEVRDENTLVNRGYIPSLLLSPQANLLVTRKNLHSDSKSKGRIGDSLNLGPPQKLQRLVMQANSPALDTFRVSIQTPRFTGVSPLKYAPPNFIVPEIVFHNQNGQLLDDRHRIFDFETTVRGEIYFAISSNGTMVAPLVADRSQGLFSALVSVPDGNSYLFKLRESTLPGFCADDTKNVFVSSNGVSLHHAQNLLKLFRFQMA
ncbi:hypothetical protein GmarT_26230 [Gimesia maris]|uniref:SLA1 homology domain-containing protein n=2 Tax=Gimesia maris TaxID=122 RepID=A0ABX5YM09_9PLAN|nr:hypothetical protein GmarT_26230 [Gimesia maris]